MCFGVCNIHINLERQKLLSLPFIRLMSSFCCLPNYAMAFFLFFFSGMRQQHFTHMFFRVMGIGIAFAICILYVEEGMASC